MACRTMWMHLHKQGVVIAIHLDVNEVKEIATCLALGPQTLASTAPERNLLSLQCLLIGFFIHIAQHQDILCVGVLYYGRHQATAFLKIYLHRYYIFCSS